ncbi:MAG TPA: glycosyltransferase [Bacteroidales bacterium]|nr:glycosyltransferase [Bacteroidales bacterium]
MTAARRCAPHTHGQGRASRAAPVPRSASGLPRGKDLPESWTGKNWACHQLSTQAEGDTLLFLDADVILTKNAIANSVNLFVRKNASMLSIFPTQIIKSTGEWLIVPLMNWLLLTFLPLLTVYKLKNKIFSAANGQFILIDSKIYSLIGGHERVKSKVVEDMELCRLVKENDNKVITVLGDKSVFCRMYNSFNEAFDGFTKNFFRGFNLSKAAFLFFISSLVILFLAPFFLLLTNEVFSLIVILILIERVFVSILSGQNWMYNILLHPLQIIIMYLIGFRSTFKKGIKWKERVL